MRICRSLDRKGNAQHFATYRAALNKTKRYLRHKEKAVLAYFHYVRSGLGKPTMSLLKANQPCLTDYRNLLFCQV